MKFKLILLIAAIYAAALSIAAFFISEQTTCRYIYLGTLLLSAVFLIILGLEDNNTLKVSWKNTLIYIMLILPGIIYGCKSGALIEQLIYYLPGIAFAAVMIIYSFKTGRGGADRDIGIVGIAAYPQTAVLALIPALLISVIATAKRNQKYPMLFPYSIVFGLLALVQISFVIGQVMI